MDYEFDKDRGEIEKYIGNEKDIVIPNQIEGVTVKSIRSHAFDGCGLNSVVIPDSVEEMGWCVFENNKLTSVTLSKNLDGIGGFKNSNLTSIEIPPSVTYISAYAFANNALTSVEIPDSVGSIGNGAFEENNLTSVKLSENLEKLQFAIFKNNNLTNITLPKKLEKIDMCVFENNNLVKITIPASVKEIDSDAFRGNKLTELVIEEGLEIIESSVFADNCLTSVTIPSSVRKIEFGAFRNNPLTSIIIEANETNKQNRFDDMWLDIGFPEHLMPGTELFDGYVFDSNTGTIKSYIGQDKTVVIPNEINGTEVKYIGYKAFAEKGLTEVVIPENIIKIKECAFMDNNLTTVTIPENIVDIEARAFANNDLTTVTIPNTIKTINFAVFQNNKLTNVNLPDQLKIIGESAFSRNLLTELSIPETVEEIYLDAFYGNNLKSLIIPDGVSVIEEYAFSHNNLTTLKIPNIEEIDEGVFSNNNLTIVEIPQSVKQIGKRAFSGNKLVSLKIPSNVETIENNAFSFNNLTDIEIPSNVRTIENWAFRQNPIETIKLHNKDVRLINKPFPDIDDTLDLLWGNRNSHDEKAIVETLDTLLMYSDIEETNVIIEMLAHYPNQIQLYKQFASSTNKQSKRAGEYLVKSVKAGEMLRKSPKEQLEYLKKSVSKAAVKKTEILDLSCLPKLYLNNSEIINNDEIVALISIFLMTNEMMLPPENGLIESMFNKECLKQLGQYLLNQWIANDMDNKLKTALIISTYYGDEQLIYEIKNLLNELIASKRYKTALQLLQALAYNGSKLSFMLLDDVANKGKTKGQKEEAKRLLRKAARNAGVEFDELLDMIVPDFGFDDTGVLQLSADNKVVDILLGDDRKLTYRDSSGKVTKTLPKNVESLKKEVNTIKKQITTVVKNQTTRLEMAFISGKTWSEKLFEDLFIKNPLVRQLSKGLVFASQKVDGTKILFTVNKEKVLETANYDEVNLNELTDVYLMHSVEETNSVLKEWKVYLKDNQIKPLVNQFDMELTYTETLDEYEITKYLGHVPHRDKESTTLYKEILKSGFTGGSEDGGYVFNYYIDLDAIKTRVVLHLPYGLYIPRPSDIGGRLDAVISFTNMKTKGKIKLDQVPKRLISTVIHRLDKVLK